MLHVTSDFRKLANPKYTSVLLTVSQYFQVCTHLERLTSELEAAAHPALDALTNKVALCSVKSFQSPRMHSNCQVTSCIQSDSPELIPVLCRFPHTIWKGCDALKIAWCASTHEWKLYMSSWRSF